MCIFHLFWTSVIFFNTGRLCMHLHNVTTLSYAYIECLVKVEAGWSRTAKSTNVRGVHDGWLEKIELSLNNKKMFHFWNFSKQFQTKMLIPLNILSHLMEITIHWTGTPWWFLCQQVFCMQTYQPLSEGSEGKHSVGRRGGHYIGAKEGDRSPRCKMERSSILGIVAYH